MWGSNRFFFFFEIFVSLVYISIFLILTLLLLFVSTKLPGKPPAGRTIDAGFDSGKRKRRPRERTRLPVVH